MREFENVDTIKVAKGRARMIAHRGVSGLERENTIAAFVAAGNRSYYGIETDVHVTADGKFILYHDDTLKRLLGLDKQIADCAYEYLRSLRLTDLNGEPREDLCLPSLEEYVRICRKYQKQAILELKNEMTKENVWKIVETVKAEGWYARTTFISFSKQNLLALRENYPDADAQFLSSHCTQEDIEYMIKNEIDADLDGRCVTAEKVKELRDGGRKINVWTLTRPEHMELVKVFDLDFVTTNILE